MTTWRVWWWIKSNTKRCAVAWLGASPTTLSSVVKKHLWAKTPGCTALAAARRDVRDVHLNVVLPAAGRFQTEPSSSASILSTLGTPPSVCKRSVHSAEGPKTCQPSVSKHGERLAVSCRTDWGMIPHISHILTRSSFRPVSELSGAARWVILVLGGIQRQMLSHSSCRSGSECWVHLHSDARRRLSFDVFLDSGLLLKVDYRSAVNSLCTLFPDYSRLLDLTAKRRCTVICTAHIICCLLNYLVSHTQSFASFISWAIVQTLQTALKPNNCWDLFWPVVFIHSHNHC